MEYGVIELPINGMNYKPINATNREIESMGSGKRLQQKQDTRMYGIDI